MRAVLGAAAVLLLAACDRPAEVAHDHLWRGDDSSEACTVVQASVFTHTPGNAGGIRSLYLTAMLRDSVPAPAREVIFLFHVEQPADSVYFPGGEAELSLAVDDSLRLRYAGRFGKPYPSEQLPGGAQESPQFRVPLADFQRIARAAKVEGRAGTLPLALDAGQVEVLREMADYVARWPRVPELGTRPHQGYDCDSDQGPANPPQVPA
jgi:hypothetical protein